MPRLIIANLDCEQDWATPDKRPRELPRDVRRRISAAGTLMAALGRPGDVLWTPAPVPEERALWAHARGVRVISGAFDSLAREPWDGVLCWGETQRTAALRARVLGNRAAASNTPDAPDAPDTPDTADSWPEALWHMAGGPDVARAARATNDRRYAFAFNQQHGSLLPGAKILSSIAALEDHLRAGGHHFGHHFGHGQGDHSTWVLEAPFSASGRFRVRRRGATLDPASRMRVWRLLTTFKELIFQPWVDRLVDVGCLGLITGENEWSIIGHHVLETNDAGVFRGIAVSASPSANAGTGIGTGAGIGAGAGTVTGTAQALAASRGMVDEVARCLARDGYRGPFGIDGFAYRDPEGAVRVYPMCEINARVSFGLLIHAAAREHGGRDLRLCMGVGRTPEADARVLPVLAAGDGDAACAWLEFGAAADGVRAG